MTETRPSVSYAQGMDCLEHCPEVHTCTMIPGATAYVLDDDADVRRTVVTVLQSIGYEVGDFSSAQPMLVGVEEKRPEAVILDLALGPCDAVDVIRQLAALNYRGKVLLISGCNEAVMNDIRQIGERHGLAMLACLKKPFRAGELIASLSLAPPVARRPATDHKPKTIRLDLAEALDAGWLELWYQTKIDLRSFSVCGAEALLRARHPRYGIVSPADILPLPSDPLHYPLSKFVIARTVADWSSFANVGLPLKLAVNLPVSVLQAADFMSVMRRLLPTEPGFPGLIIEVTEDEMVRDPMWIREVAVQLKLLNVGISIDDFGTAYSSLSRLLELPCVELKLDRSFVLNCSSNPLKHALCQTVIDLAHRVGSVVCAEGVETPEDLRAVVEMGCDAAQGFLFSKPLPPSEFSMQLIAGGAEFARRMTRLLTPPVVTCRGEDSAA